MMRNKLMGSYCYITVALVRKSAGMKYLKAAAKSNPKLFISTYQMGHRAYKGIDQPINLSTAANWMLKSYNAFRKDR